MVVRVREYLLFGKYEDVQIDIRPEELGGTIVTLLFINDPAVTIGERVEAGKTLLGTVRQCPPGDRQDPGRVHPRLRFARTPAGIRGAHPLNARFCSKCGGAIEVQPVGDRPREVCSLCGEIFYHNPLPAAAALVLDDQRTGALGQARHRPQQG